MAISFLFDFYQRIDMASLIRSSSLITTILLFSPLAKAESIVPNFTQGVLNSHTEVKSTVTEDIKEFRYRTGYQFTVGGENLTPSTTNISPAGFTKGSGSVQGTATTYVMPNLSNKPQYNITDPSKAFSYYETLETPGVESYVHILRTTEIEQVTDTTSTFQ